MRRDSASFALWPQQEGKETNGQSLPALDNETQKDGLDFVHDLITKRARLKYYNNLRYSNNVLDSSTGTGIWAAEMARQIERYGGKVVGFGASNLQLTSNIPKNLTLLEEGRDDLWGENDRFDLIHTRVLPSDTRNWPEFYKEAYEHLKSGCYLEIEALNLELLFDSSGSTLKPRFFLDHLIMPKPEDDKQHLNFEKTKELLESAGFVNVKEDIINLPINPWSERDPELGQRFNMVLQFLLKTGQYAPPDLSSKAPAWKEIYERSHRGYCRLFVWSAEKAVERRIWEHS